MRLRLALPVLAGCAAAAIIPCSPAAAADWNSPYMYRETHGSWTNVEYNDGTCHYRYSYNVEDQQTYLNRWGDCSYLAIGPGGIAARIVAAPAYAMPLPGDRY